MWSTLGASSRNDASFVSTTTELVRSTTRQLILVIGVLYAVAQHQARQGVRLQICRVIQVVQDFMDPARELLKGRGCDISGHQAHPDWKRTANGLETLRDAFFRDILSARVARPTHRAIDTPSRLHCQGRLLRNLNERICVASR